MQNNELSTENLWEESRQVQLTLTRPTPTTLLLSWNLPPTTQVYDGQVVLLSTSLLETPSRPTDGIRYTPSANLLTPADTIGGAQVVSAEYGIFNGNLTTTSVLITDAIPTEVYYASLHGCSNTLQYYGFGSKSYALDGTLIDENVDGYTGSVPRSTTPPLNPTLGQVYYNPISNTVSMWNGATWIPASTDTVATGKIFPTTPTQGAFFYNLNTHILFIWDGTNWTKANTSQEGSPSINTIDVGTTGSFDERVRLVNLLKSQLGWPAVCVELQENNFETAIDIALSELRRRSDTAYRRHHVLFTIKAGQPTYYLNDAVIGTNRIVDIYKAHRVSTIGLNVLGGDNGIYAQMFYNQFFYGAVIDILSIHLAQSLAEDFERLFAGNLMFEWNESTRELMFLRKLYKDEKVVLECWMERTEQELFTDRWTKNWIRDYALAKCWETLGMIRGKYSSLPGPGGIQMNGDTLLNRADTMITELQRQINDYEVGNFIDSGNCAMLLG